MSFQNKVVLITGSGSGIGAATAISFAKEGADVVIIDCNEDNANETREKCAVFSNRVMTIKADVTNNEEVKAAIEKIIDEFGQLDVLINNAGIYTEGNLLSGTIMETYDKIMNTNLRGVILVTSLATPYLMKTKGCIVNISSTISTVNVTKLDKPTTPYAYILSKSGVDCFTRLSALELASSGVRVNAVNPGPVNTNLLRSAQGDVNFTVCTALKRISEPQEIADLIMYLASDKARSITGSLYNIDNGFRLI